MPNQPTVPNFPPQGIQAQLDLLYLYNPDAANKMIAELQAGLLEMKELEQKVQEALAGFQGVMRYKGSVPTEADLPDITPLDTDIKAVQAVIPSTASETNQLVTEDDLMAHTELPSQEGNAGKVLTTNGATPLWTDAGGSDLPEQTGHTGFLQTDGTEASWSDYTPLKNQSSVNTTYSLAIGTNGVPAKGDGGNYNLAIGAGAITRAIRSTAVGYSAQALQINCIQLGSGVNNEANTLKVCTHDVNNYTLLGPGGLIPSERLAAGGTAGQILSKSDTGMEWVTASGLPELPEDTTKNYALERNGEDAPAWVEKTATPASTGGNEEYGLKADYLTENWCRSDQNTGSGLIGIVDYDGGKAIRFDGNMIFDIPGTLADPSRNLITFTSGDTWYIPITKTTDCWVAYVHGSDDSWILCDKVCFQTAEPASDSSTCQLWWNGKEWKYRDINYGYTWIPVRAHVFGYLTFTNGTPTRFKTRYWFLG